MVLSDRGFDFQTVFGKPYMTEQDVMEANLALDMQIEAEKKRTEEIEEFRKYTKTKKYIEDVAREKLGLVYEDEIIIQTDED